MSKQFRSVRGRFAEELHHNTKQHSPITLDLLGCRSQFHWLTTRPFSTLLLSQKDALAIAVNTDVLSPSCGR